MPDPIFDYIFAQIAPYASTLAMAHILCCVGLAVQGIGSNQPEMVIAFLNTAAAVGSLLWMHWVSENNGGTTTTTTYVFLFALVLSLSGVVSVLVRSFWFGQLPPDYDSSDDEEDDTTNPSPSVPITSKTTTLKVLANMDGKAHKRRTVGR